MDGGGGAPRTLLAAALERQGGWTSAKARPPMGTMKADAEEASARATRTRLRIMSSLAVVCVGCAVGGCVWGWVIRRSHENGKYLEAGRGPCARQEGPLTAWRKGRVGQTMAGKARGSTTPPPGPQAGVGKPLGKKPWWITGQKTVVDQLGACTITPHQLEQLQGASPPLHVSNPPWTPTHPPPPPPTLTAHRPRSLLLARSSKGKVCVHASFLLVTHTQAK